MNMEPMITDYEGDFLISFTNDDIVVDHEYNPKFNCLFILFFILLMIILSSLNII